jgi:hypothetical protein
MESSSVQVSVTQFAADSTRIREEAMRDGADEKKDTVQYGGTLAHLLRSGRRVPESTERKITTDLQNRGFEETEVLHEQQVDKVKDAVVAEDWRRVGQRGKVF